MKLNTQRYSLLITCLVGAIIVFILFKPVIQHPNSYLFSHKCDGVKSYYNFGYYLKYGSGIKHTGVNYPYGDHLLYMNSHSLASQVIKGIDHVIPTKNYGPGILNLFMICSLVLALPFVFLILRHYKLPGWYAGFVSLFIVFNSPQLQRIHGHFEMVYLFFIPAFWLFFLKWRSGKRPVLWVTITVLTGIIGGFTSAFFAAFYGIFFLSYWLVEFIRKRKNLKQNIRYLSTIFIVAILPVLVVKVFVSTTDWFSDRPTDPWGYFLFHSNLSSIFLPSNTHFQDLWGGYFDMSYEWEGRAYVGTPAMLLSAGILITAIHNLFSYRSISWKLFFPKSTLNIYLMAAILTLLFSMCFPFKNYFTGLLDVFPILKQFRSLGRFSWIFYFVFNVYTACFFYRIFRFAKFKKVILVPGLTIFIIFFTWHLDAGVNTKKMMYGLIQPNDLLESNDNTYLSRFEKANIKTEEFQAIFCLPFVNTCGDKLVFERNLNGLIEGYSCSYHTGIPIVQSYSPRVSFSSALSSIQLMADSCIRKTRLDDMNKKPLLLIYHKNDLKPGEKELIQQSQTFWENETTGMAKLPIEAFNKGYNRYIDTIAKLKDSISYEGNTALHGAKQAYIYQNFDDKEADYTFNGQGANFVKGNTSLKLFEIDSLDTKRFGHSIELSFWVLVDQKVHSMPEAFFQEYDSNGNRNYEKKIDRNTHNVYNNWARYSMTFELKDNMRYEMTIYGKRITVDDLLFRPTNTNVFIKVDEKTELINNYPMKVNK